MLNFEIIGKFKFKVKFCPSFRPSNAGLMHCRFGNILGPLLKWAHCVSNLHVSLPIVFTDINMAGVKVQHWINQVEAVLDSRAEITTLSSGDIKTILTPGVLMNLKLLHCVRL